MAKKRARLIDHPEWHPEITDPKQRKARRLGPTLAEMLADGTYRRVFGAQMEAELRAFLSSKKEK